MMKPEPGLYEQLINKLFYNKLQSLNEEEFFVKTTVLDKAEAARCLSQYLSEIIRFALTELKGDDRLLKQLTLSNKIIQVLIDELPGADISNNLLENDHVLQAIFSKLDSPYIDFSDRLKQITPYTRLSQSELFTGNNVGVSLESEIRKEILSADEIYWLVSFIKFSGIRIFKEELEEFTNSGRKLKIITTSYMGATDLKAIEFLSNFKNTEIKISYNGDHERLHAKAYLFLRNTGFHTGYIGSSNISRSALTNGLEWNLKVTTREIGHIIDKFRKTFETYWEDKEFEYYQPGKDKEKLSKALKSQSSRDRKTFKLFDLTPHKYQQEILEKLEAERLVHHRHKNLVVAATGTGKTVISAFDYKRFRTQNTRSRLLFVTHRKEILEQAQETFRHVLKDTNFGELWVDGLEPGNLEYVFASVQTLRNRVSDLKLSPEFYDFIIIDEVHHAPANSYRFIFDRFAPKVLLGLTATPERMDGEDILNDFCNTIAAEIRLPEAINRKLLSPFQYFAVSDSIDLSQVTWRNGRHDITELTNLYTAEDRRVSEVLENCEKYLTDLQEVRALAFCVSQAHAQYMAEKFSLAKLKADYLTSSSSPGDRDSVRHRLKSKEINFLFVVDIFNEGVDIPEIDTVLFLRPTESLTIFLQQLGRGLRLADSKECLTVLDFVGNANEQYDFEHKFRALVGRTHSSIEKEIEDEFPHSPLGCSIVLEKKAKETILRNIRKAIGFNRNQLIAKIRSFKLNSTLSLTLKNFLAFNHLELPLLYKKGSWKRLLAAAGEIADFVEPQERELKRFITQLLLQANSYSYLIFIKRIIQENREITNPIAEDEIRILMLHYDLWREAGPKLGYRNLTESLLVFKQNPVMCSAIEELIDLLIDQINFIEKEIKLPFPTPHKIHSRYNRDQILTALGLHTFEKASSNREGVALNKELNVEALFITLKKSEREYSPTTLYDDYAINEYLFHWQSQNATSPESPKGMSYRKHHEMNKTILLFVREQNDDEYGNTMSYVFLGDANFRKSSGSKPMNIEWELNEPMPAYLWKDSGKWAVG
ncbi:DEAD/DEAH box helicase [Desertivirga arenae]|uniref:DEAD/DEAH box helicase n=1 Tax=Desertivirga arenae TaxID=2810309 RepID=UPI001A9780CB|nr:DEAD/DEAH box helicase [Pedobacter sp. SYSU D00823]